ALCRGTAFGEINRRRCLHRLYHTAAEWLVLAGSPEFLLSGALGLNVHLHFLGGSSEINHAGEGRLTWFSKQAKNLAAIADQLYIGADYYKVGFGEWIIRTSPTA